MGQKIALTVTVNMKNGIELHDLETECYSFDGITERVSDLLDRHGVTEYSSLVIVAVPVAS